MDHGDIYAPSIRVLNASMSASRLTQSNQIFDDAAVAAGYEAVPNIEIVKLPRGGLSVDTKAIGRIQFGLPPETIKDSMLLGINVPAVYIVPIERFCREASPALGINLAEFEFPCYFNYFVRGKRCTLIVDSVDAEKKITQVFQETLMGPAQFRRNNKPLSNETEDFHPSYPVERRPNFAKESKWWRHQEATEVHDELCIEMLLDFKHFLAPSAGEPHSNIGVPSPPPPQENNCQVIFGEAHSGGVLKTRRHSSILGRRLNAIVNIPVDREIAPNLRRSLNNMKSSIIGDELDVSSSSSSLISLEDRTSSWTYSQLKWLGDVCTIYPQGNEISHMSARVEIFKMAGGTEYIVHDIDENNHIIGKTCFSGTVQVSDFMEVIGFAPGNNEYFDTDNQQPKNVIPRAPTFVPPNFGVTVLGNSHGFDKSGSTSGYVLWINGRGVMIDPPPYSSVTLEREGIRPRLIVAILLTHIHADHDGGAFQKILTGSRVSLITTPTIYKSFIRKYSALSGLSPSLLRHSHRCRLAIIGQPLRFHGATFHFTYAFHTIPCLAFRVEWGRKSIIFTGDHLNNPPVIKKLEKMGVISKERADDLINFPLQECDLLLHESGAPPIHTQLDELLALPEIVKKRMYIVHTAALPKDCPLKVAPTGTKGTIRLDRDPESEVSVVIKEEAPHHDNNHVKASSNTTANLPNNNHLLPKIESKTSVSDTWFVLNLLSEVPFLSSLPYSATMELLEAAQVYAFDAGAVVVSAELRSAVFCVVWEGTCMERKRSEELKEEKDMDSSETFVKELEEAEDLAVWHAGDWTGPLSIQPDFRMSGESRDAPNAYDVVAVSEMGVKAITWDMKDMHFILQWGSSSYVKYLADKRKNNEKTEKAVGNSAIFRNGDAEDDEYSTTESTGLSRQSIDTSFLSVLSYNSALGKLSAVQKRHLESLSEGPVRYERDHPIWWLGGHVHFAYLIVSGTAVFRSSSGKLGTKQPRRATTGNIAESCKHGSQSDRILVSSDSLFGRNPRDKELKVSPNSEYARLEKYLKDRIHEMEGETYSVDLSPKERRLRDSQDRFANIVLGRLYSRRSWTAGLAFSRGHFLADTSRMMSGNLTGCSEEAVDNSRSEGIQLKDLLCNVQSTNHHVHRSNLCAGPDGCTVWVFPRKSLVSFLDAQPGLLLSFLGTQVIV